jgi:hypothetical protein
LGAGEQLTGGYESNASFPSNHLYILREGSAMRKIVLLLLPLMLLVRVNAQSAPTAYKMADSCRSKNWTEQGLCVCWIMGIRTVIDELPVLVPDRSAQIHIEQKATNGELSRVFVKYVDEHPEDEHRDAFLVFCWALRDAKLMSPE